MKFLLMSIHLQKPPEYTIETNLSDVNKTAVLLLYHMSQVNNLCSLLFLFRLRDFSLIWRHRHCRWRAANFDLCSAPMTIEHCGFFSVPHLLWHRASAYNSQLRGPVTLTLYADRLTLELLLPVLMT